MEIIGDLPRLQEYIFSTLRKGDKPVSGFSRAKQRTDQLVMSDLDGSIDSFADWRLHDLRRTTASGIAEIGCPIQVLSKILNHSDRSVMGVTGVYNRFAYETEKRQALQSWGNKLVSIVQTNNLIGGDTP